MINNKKRRDFGSGSGIFCCLVGILLVVVFVQQLDVSRAVTRFPTSSHKTVKSYSSKRSEKSGEDEHIIPRDRQYGEQEHREEGVHGGPADGDVARKNSYDVVHVFASRFQCYQPTLSHLGNARLEMLKAIALPSMLKQTNKEFLWMIHVDPELDQDMLGSLLQILEEAKRQDPALNIVVRSSNEGAEHSAPTVFVRNSTSFGLEGDPILFGSRGLMRRYHEASQSRLVLESILDLDDALSYDFVDFIQRNAARDYKEYHRQQLQSQGHVYNLQHADKYFSLYGVNSYVSSSVDQIEVGKRPDTPFSRVSANLLFSNI